MDAFATALDARARWATAVVAYPGCREGRVLLDGAAALVDQLARANPYGDCPRLLADVPYLRQRFAQGAEKYRAIGRSVVARLACEDWAGLALPDPASLTATLRAGLNTTVADHDLYVEDGLVWCGTPYGIDVILCQTPTEAAIRRFLTRMAMGETLGPIP
jgi:hypothetical protein